MLVESILINGEVYYRVYNRQQEHIVTLDKHLGHSWYRFDYIDKIGAIQEMVIGRLKNGKSPLQKNVSGNTKSNPHPTQQSLGESHEIPAPIPTVK